MINRRKILAGIAGGSGLLLSGCDRFASSARGTKFLDMGEKLTYLVQRSLLGRNALAPEYTKADLSPIFRTNGNTMPKSPAYQALIADNFASWSLKVDGLVEKPLSLTLADLQAMPQQTQITQHNCVEGWTAIGGWTGVRLAAILHEAKLKPAARYIMFYCADDFEGTPYYESIDLVDAFHPQTMLALQLNGQPLEVKHGAPTRLRVERQLGYKQAKYVMHIAAVSSFADIGGGKGGYWEDEIDYEWYAGI
ncbi:MAG: molybdopterin-binding protein [Hyphomicrobiales bacterium]|nr:molybdopterin-binding protein [Hyphomicrobiales bacterium]